VFERFTDRARRVVVLAQEEARRLDHTYIGTEHILLGLVHEGEGVAAMALSAMDISLEEVRTRVQEIVGRGEAAPTGHIPFTPRGKKVLELSLREALQLGHKYIGTEHILLGLVREGEGVGAQVLQKLGADLNRVRQTVIQLLSDYTVSAEGEEPMEIAPTPPGDTGEAAVQEFEQQLVAYTESKVSGRRELLPLKDPLCPVCRASLAETARVQSRDLASAEAPAETIKIAYCAKCGITLGIKIV
jgi:ATP-dependent Clp protease ATP-binding subunit ClpC